MHHIVVDQRSHRVHKQDRQHHAFRITGIQHPDQHRHHPDQESVNVLADVRLAAGHRIGRHKDRTEGEPADNQVVICRNIHVGVRADQVEQQAHQIAAGKHAEHHAPTGDARPQQDRRADQDRQRRSFADTSGYRPEEPVQRTALRPVYLLRAGQHGRRRIGQRSRPRKTVYDALAFGQAGNPDLFA